MIKMDSSRYLMQWMSMSFLLVLTACGGLEMNTGNWGPQLANRPGSSDVFINATAVKVGKGDTVYSIARRHKLSPRDIIVANNLRAPYKLYVGQRLKLPQGQIHTVRSGEYLALIAKRYKTDTWAIARINGIRQPYTIYPGQKLRIPRSGTVSPSTAPTRTASKPTRTTKTVTSTGAMN